MAKKIFTDESLATFVDETKSYVDSAVSNKADTNHNHDSKYDAKGSANTALESANSYTNNVMETFGQAFEGSISVIYGNDEYGSSIREIANDESNKVQTNLDSHASNTSLHFTTAEKTKLSGVESGAQKNTITGVKGNSESSYRTGNVNITKSNIGLGNVDNTSDANKPVSTAQQTAIDNSLSSAKSYTDTKISNLINSAPTTLDTLGEIATAMAENEDVVEALESAVGNKVDKVSGKGLSTNDLTATLKSNYDTAYSHVSNKSNPHGVTLSQLGVNATAAELNYVDGVTSSIQTQLDGKAASNHNHIYYGTCSTAADTVAKTVTVDNFELKTGAMVIVKFTNANSASNPTLNVNNTGAKPMYRYGTTVVSTGTTTTGWYAGAVQMFVYDGTGWVRDYWNNTTYSNASLGSGYATCSTAADTTAKVGTLSSYSLTTGGIVSVKFTYDVPASATLNINSKGAKNIYFRGAAITAGVIKAGDIATFVYSSQYHLIAIDRWQNDIASIQTTLSGKSDSDHTHNYAGSSSAGGAATSANKVNKSLTVKLNSGTTEGTNMFTFDGSSAKSVNITPSAIGAAASSHGTHVSFADANPAMDGTASAGASSMVARADHVHPTDTSRAAATHSHSATDITSGTLSTDRLPTVPIEKGGTGATTVDNALKNLNLTSSSTSNADVKVNTLTIGDATLSYDSTNGILRIAFS